MLKPNSFGAEHYNEVKKSFKLKDGKYPDYYYGYMMFVPSYNGKMWGSFAKDGAREYQKQHYLSIINQFPKIKDCKFAAADYKDLSIKNSLIYCDIPYYDSKKQYYDENFDYEDFYNWCRENSKYNKIYISETQMPEDFKVVWQKEYVRTTSMLKNKPITIEKLFTF